MITNIRLKSLRRLKNISLNTNHKLIIFVGPNAIGKTTILEGIYVAAVGSSFKTRNFKELIRFNDSYTKISLTNDDNVYNVILSESGRKMLIMVILSLNYQIILVIFKRFYFHQLMLILLNVKKALEEVFLI